ncbi:gliding motility-associated C-terminal domain-containing protein [Aurantibacter sp.]|uniref:gliding motility-associated C-terminal domain-containing protein n=1 Tax=Aurantibacter sp. TaxID=2807103 RepID=UPI003266250B
MPSKFLKCKKNNSKNLWLALVFIFQAIVLQAQCDITNFTATPIVGACVQDASIDIQITGATDCTTVPTFAEIFESESSTALNLITLSTSGTGTFPNLRPGSYDVVLRQGNDSSSQEGIEVTSTYTPMSLTPSATNTSCSATDTNNPANGAVSLSVTGGVGPFTYRLILDGTVIETENNTSATSHSFSGLAPAEYRISVTDNSVSCTSSETRSVTVAETVNIPIQFYYERTRPDEDTCGLVTYRLAITYGNKLGLALGTAASATLNGGATIYADLISNNTNTVYDFTGLTPGDVLTNIQVSDICNAITRPDLVLATLPDDYLDVSLEASKTEDCLDGVNINVEAQVDGGLPEGRIAYTFQVSNTLSVYKEEPAGSGSFVLLETRNNVRFLSNSGGRATFTFDDPTATYQIVAEDDCHRVERIITPDVTYENPLFKIGLEEGPSLLEGTSAINIRKTQTNGNLTHWAQLDPLNYPITATITRTDGSSNIVINPNQPYTLAGSYSYDFPMTAVYVDNPNESADTKGWYYGPNIGNLPIGEYEVLFTDSCGDTFTQTIDLTAPVTYNPSITFNQGCAAADIVFDMGDSNVIDESETTLYENNNGELGALVRNSSENPDEANSGQFSSIPPGDYIIHFDDLVFREFIPGRAYQDWTNFDAALNAFERMEYQVAVTVPEYEQMSFYSISFFCDSADDNSGILGIMARGIPVGETTYSIWEDTLDPEIDAPTQTYTTTDSTELEYVFQNLSVGTYIIRVSNECGYTQEIKTLQHGPFIFPETDPNPLVICPGETSTMFVALPNILFDFAWTDSSGTALGNENTLEVTPNQTETYTVYYSLKPSFGCTNSPEGPYELEVEVYESAELIGIPTTTCSEDNSSYTLSFEVSGEAPFIASGTGAPGIWEGNIWTSDNIDISLDYNITIQDANECTADMLVVNGLAPTDCVEDCVLKVNNLFTPLEVDGINDFFTIECIENYPDSTLKIFNRWGVLVYETTNYLNTWDGESTGRATLSSNNKVPAGTYYYVLDLKINEEPITGWLFLN